MSTTICLGYTPSDKGDIFQDIQALSSRFGYGVLNGILFAEPDVRWGVEAAKKHQGWENVLLLQAPIDRDVGLAFGIEQEMMDLFFGKIQRPLFFDFLVDLTALCAGNCEKLGVLFASECFEGDPIRYCQGNTDDLIRFLATSMSWELTYIGSKPNELQSSDEVPLLFNIRVR
ncbi:hypothetical protein [Roseinatronobacter alkalisoli]|uniref:Nucleoside 2-deoxyribosyltransferase n=1 Tax=Roseinatronobacter alkalisoli TaxID=3028235 RepID=A0ABT5TIG1_9RHOB|nr:hypothetical protein [Roseinatronobacter sp. HJB301]MDD7973997.1 hypothetical protein [Roseinatronobacter sp. HJB301]